MGSGVENRVVDGFASLLDAPPPAVSPTEGLRAITSDTPIRPVTVAESGSSGLTVEPCFCILCHAESVDRDAVKRI
jgi:hypothetical protein